MRAGIRRPRTGVSGVSAGAPHAEAEPLSARHWCPGPAPNGLRHASYPRQCDGTESVVGQLPEDPPRQRLKCGLATALAWLGARAARYAFPIRLFHSRVRGGLSRRYPELGSARASGLGVACVSCLV